MTCPQVGVWWIYYFFFINHKQICDSYLWYNFYIFCGFSIQSFLWNLKLFNIHKYSYSICVSMKFVMHFCMFSLETCKYSYTYELWPKIINTITIILYLIIFFSIEADVCIKTQARCIWWIIISYYYNSVLSK